MRFQPILAAALLFAFAPWTIAAQPPQQIAQAANAPKALGGDKSWSAFSAGSGKGLVCYLVGTPSKTLPEHVTRGRVGLDVTHRPGENTFNVVNFQLGYDTKAGLDADLMIDGKKFALFTAKQGAWAKDSATDKTVTMALDKGKVAVIKATSAHDNTSTDTYSLDGFSTALGLIDKACDVKR